MTRNIYSLENDSIYFIATVSGAAQSYNFIQATFPSSLFRCLTCTCIVVIPRTDLIIVPHGAFPVHVGFEDLFKCFENILV